MTDERRFGGGDESRVQALMAENARLREALALARSMIRCGESMTPTSAQMIDGALRRDA